MSASPPDLPPLREVIARHDLRAKKSLGQHFLLDLNLTARIARAAGELRGRTVLEVGPGPGGLTRALLLAGADRVVAVERDRRCVAALADLEAAFPGRLQVVAADALEVDEAALLSGPARLVSNLPYNISTALLLKWLRRPLPFESYTLMFQKEVADRLLAAPGGKAYGRLSIIVQWLMQAKPLFEVSPAAFTPPPKVTSTVVGLVPRAQPLAPAEFGALETLTAAAFGQRRKMLRAALRTLAPEPERLLAEAGIAPTRRAEELSVLEFCALARAFTALRAGA